MLLSHKVLLFTEGVCCIVSFLLISLFNVQMMKLKLKYVRNVNQCLKTHLGCWESSALFPNSTLIIMPFAQHAGHATITILNILLVFDYLPAM